jgi:plastocyanin
MRKLLLPLIVLLFVAAPAFAATTSTSLKDDKFTKSRLVVKKGDVVKWTWKTKNPHTVSDYKGRWSSKVAKRLTYRHKFRRRGKFTVYCKVHPVEMRQRIIVK